MNLIIDIGNTNIKLAVFRNDEIISKKSIVYTELTNSVEQTLKNFKIKNSILSTVGKLNTPDVKYLINQLNPLILNNNSKLPFLNKYKTPKTLGVDRIALVASAVCNFPNQNVLVIDAGTCITYDYINSKKEYYGGSISPGIEMRYKSINTFTANLPQLELINSIPKVGDSTQNAIHRGVLNGIVQEIDGVIEQYRSKNEKLTIVLTGGDTIFLAKNIKSTIFANPNFLLEGLNRILIYNIDE